MAGKFSWKDRLTAVLPCLPCSACFGRAESEDEQDFHSQQPAPLQNAREELQRLLEADAAETDHEAETLSLHSNFGARNKNKKRRRRRGENRKHIRVFGYDLFGRPADPDLSDDDLSPSRPVRGLNSAAGTSTISSSGFDSDAAPIPEADIARLAARWQPRQTEEELAAGEEAQRLREERRAKKKERRELKKAAVALAAGIGEEEFEGFPGSGSGAHISPVAPQPQHQPPGELHIPIGISWADLNSPPAPEAEGEFEGFPGSGSGFPQHQHHSRRDPRIPIGIAFSDANVEFGAFEQAPAAHIVQSQMAEDAELADADMDAQIYARSASRGSRSGGSGGSGSQTSRSNGGGSGGRHLHPANIPLPRSSNGSDSPLPSPGLHPPQIAVAPKGRSKRSKASNATSNSSHSLPSPTFPPSHLPQVQVRASDADDQEEFEGYPKSDYNNGFPAIGFSTTTRPRGNSVASKGAFLSRRGED